MSNPIHTITNERILLSPLNWGLGHVTRTIPVIKKLLAQGNEMIICCNGAQENFYRDYFPDLWYVNHEGYPFQFNGDGNWELDILKSFRQLNKRLKQELVQVEVYKEKFNPSLIISDQRFGFRNSSIKSVLISHQIKLPVNGLSKIAQFQNYKLLKKFDEVWVPDTLEENLSGKLSASSKGRCIGNLSRFNKQAMELKYKYVGIVSGPMPYAKEFFQLLRSKFSVLEEDTCIIVSKTVADYTLRSINNCKIVIQPNFEEMQNILNSSEVVISRAGYSTLMDLNAMNKKAILVPTPGQKEQLYLSEHNKGRALWTFYNEQEFSNLMLTTSKKLR